MTTYSLPKEVNDLFVTELKRLEYGTRTIKIYVGQLKAFGVFIQPKHINSATPKEIKEYLEHLRDRKKLSAQTRSQIFWSINFYYNNLLQKKFNLEDLKVERKFVRPVQKIITPEQVLKIIANSSSFRDRILISLTYATALDLGEVMKLKPEDIDFKNQLLRIPTKKFKSRYAILPKILIQDLNDYLKTEKPDKFLFPGLKKGMALSSRSIQTAFNTAAKNAGFVGEFTFRILKYSYVKHLEKFGYDTVSILEAIGNNNSLTVYQYLLMDREVQVIKDSPLDLISNSRKNPISTDKLKSKIELLTNPDEKEYLNEAIECFNRGLLRPGVVFAWIAAIRNIQYKLLTHSLHALNTSIQTHNKNAKDVRTIEDFAFIKESVQLKAACDLNEIDKNEKTTLETCLDLRNNCGHPSKYKPEEHKVLAFLEDLLTIVFK